MVCDAFRVATFSHSMDLIRHDQLLLFHYLEISDYIDCGLRGDESQLVQLVILEALILDLDDTLFPEEFAAEVDSYWDLFFYASDIQDVQRLLYIFSGYGVQYGSILQCADYQFFSAHNLRFVDPSFHSG